MKSKYLLVGLLALTACVQENLETKPEQETEQEQEQFLGSKFIAIAPEFKLESAGQSHAPQTKVDVEIKDKIAAYRWRSDDYIGIFPKADTEDALIDGDQIYFNIIPDPADNNGKTASFDGGGWTVKEGYTYLAYTPFNRDGGFGQNKTAMPIDFTNQIWNKEGDYLNKRIHMLSEGKVDRSSGVFYFDFKALTCLGICKINIRRTNIPGAKEDEGYLKSLTFEFPNDVKPFVETGTFDVTKAKVVEPEKDIPVDAITATTTSNTLTLTAPLEEAERFTYTHDAGYYMNPAADWLFSQAALQGIADKTCRVTLEITSTDIFTSGQEFTLFTDFTFKKDWVPGHAYVLDLYFPWIVKKSHTIEVATPGTLRLSHVQAAMDGTGILKVIGSSVPSDNLNEADFDVLRKAAGKGAQSVDPKNLLKDLDLMEANEFGEFTLPSFAGTKLTRIVLPKNYDMSLGAEAFKDVPLETLEWSHRPGWPYDGKLDPNAFNGLATENCNLKISNTLFKYLSADAEGNMLFNGKKFKTYQEIKLKRDENDGHYFTVYEDIKTTTVDASAHSINAHFAGFLTAANITEALASGTVLKVTGPLNDRDITTIGTTAGAKLTSLTFESKDKFVPKADSFAGFSNSANCDLVIPGAWRSLVTNTDGKVMFANKVWKSVVADQLDGMDLGGFGGEDQDKPMFN